MGVGISLSGLASAVANEGGIGVISAAIIGFRESDLYTNYREANIRALRQEIQAELIAPVQNGGDTVLAPGAVLLGVARPPGGSKTFRAVVQILHQGRKVTRLVARLRQKHR